MKMGHFRKLFCSFLCVCVCNSWAAIMWARSAQSTWNICFPTPVTQPGFAAPSTAGSGESGQSPERSSPVSLTWIILLIQRVFNWIWLKPALRFSCVTVSLDSYNLNYDKNHANRVSSFSALWRLCVERVCSKPVVYLKAYKSTEKKIVKEIKEL